MLLDVTRLVILPQPYQEAFMDGFETVVVLLCAIACGFAAARSSPVGRGLWIMPTVFFVLIASADLHDFLQDISFSVGPLSSAINFLGWCAYIPLALLIFYPMEKDGRPDWSWLPFLDFLLVTGAVSLATFQLIYLPRSLSGQPWTVVGFPELLRNVLLSIGLLLRAGVDPSFQARTFYGRVGGVFAGVAFLRCLFADYLDPVFAFARPALWLVLGLLAVYWESKPGDQTEPGGRRAALSLFLSLSAATTLVLVVVLALTAPAPYQGLMYVGLGVSVVLFILRSALVEHTRHDAETKLRSSERDYRVLFESAVVPILILEPESERILQANAAACELYGAAPGGLVGDSLKDFSRNVPRGEEHVAELLRTGACHRFESVHRTRDGKEIEVLVSSSVIQYRGQKAILSFIRDFTERKRAEEARQESEARFRTLIEEAPVAIGISRNGVIIYVNKRYLEIFGYPTGEELIGRPIAGQWAPPCRDEIEELVRKHSLGLPLPTKYEGMGQRRDGSQFPVHSETTHVGLPDGPATIAFITDITERKQAEERFYKAFTASPEPITISTLSDGTYVDVNESFLRASGFVREDLIGHRAEDVHFWVEPQARPRLLDLLSQGPVRDFELAFRQKSGEVRMGLLSAEVIELGGQRCLLALTKDVTERKRAQEALQRSEQRYQDFIKHSKDGVWRIELEKPIPLGVSADEAIQCLLQYAYFAECNDAMAQIAGLGHAEDLIGKHLGDLISPADQERLESFRAAAQQGWQSRTIQLEVTHPAGRRKVLERTEVPIVEDGKVIRIWGMTRDITEFKQARETIKQSEDRFRKAFMTGADAFYIATLDDGRIIDANDRFQDVFGYSRDEAIGKTSLQLGLYADPDDRRKMVSEIKSKGYVRNLELEARRKGGDPITVLASVNLLQGSKEQLILGVFRDVTEHRHAEEALIRLRQAVDASGEVIFMTDREGIITFVNTGFTRLYGYTEDEVLGKVTPRILKSGITPPENYSRFWRAILEKRVARGQVLNRRKDGRLVTVESSVNPVLDKSGNIEGFLAIQRDITERKQLEEQFRQAQKMEAVGRLAGGVAHDFNNLLTIINGYAQLILERTPPEDASRAQLREILNAGERATGLTRQLLAFSRKQVLEPKVVDLNVVVEGMQKMLRRLIGEDIELHTVAGNQLGLVKADPTQIEQVILNLAVNGRDAMPHGGKLTIETANAELDEDYARTQSDVAPGHYVVLGINDTGMGMDGQTMAHIFEPFFTTKERGKGTGLGLSTVYGIVKQTGGHISVQSEPGRGTKFKVYLPEIERLSEGSAPEEDLARPRGGSETILLVEDEVAVRALAVRVLKGYGYKVLESTSPEHAVELSERQEEPIDLLMTDVVMPGMSGRDIAEHLGFTRPQMKVLYVSGYTDDIIAHHGVLEARTAFLQKPFSPEALARKVRAVLDTPPLS